MGKTATIQKVENVEGLGEATVLVSLAQMGYLIRVSGDGGEEFKKSVVWS